ncbi:hypothetical protein M405DRAFT_431797 [Rhizopogon salebrosus TDB-379]|nr:hypothetical protein M405DRAFT_431797 [Rhizopogon salebrosus TDB-379]
MSRPLVAIHNSSNSRLYNLYATRLQLVSSLPSWKRLTLVYNVQSRHASLELPVLSCQSQGQAQHFLIMLISRGNSTLAKRNGSINANALKRNRPITLSRPATPELHHRHSLEFHRRHSQEMPWTSPSHIKSLFARSRHVKKLLTTQWQEFAEKGRVASLRSFDDDRSSKPSSMSSQADYRDRMAEPDRDSHVQREREWNKLIHTASTIFKPY